MKKFFNKHKKTIGLSIVAIIILLFVSLFFKELTTIITYIIQGDIDKAKNTLQSFGWQGIFILCMVQIIFIVSMFLPLRTIQTIAGLTYPLKTALIMNFISTIVGGAIVYYLARHKNMEVDEEDLRKSGLEKLLAKYNKHGVSVVIFLSFVFPGSPIGAAFYFASKCNISFRRFCILSITGNIVAIAAYTVLGSVLVNYLHNPIVLTLFFILIVGMIITSAIAFIKKYKKKKKKIEPNDNIK